MAARPSYSRMMLWYFASWLRRNASMTVPICLYVSSSLSRRGLKVVKPAASCPRFCRSNSMRGISRDTHSAPAAGAMREGVGLSK